MTVIISMVITVTMVMLRMATSIVVMMKSVRGAGVVKMVTPPETGLIATIGATAASCHSGSLTTEVTVVELSVATWTALM